MTDPVPRKIETSVSFVEFLPSENLILWKYKLGSVVTKSEALEEVEAISKVILELFDCRVKLMIDISGVKKVTREARAVFSSPQTTEMTQATALVMGSRVSTVIANLFISLSRPQHATRIFHSSDEAKDWLDAQESSKLSRG